jgi:hypothetical protein
LTRLTRVTAPTAPPTRTVTTALAMDANNGTP